MARLAPRPALLLAPFATCSAATCPAATCPAATCPAAT